MNLVELLTFLEVLKEVDTESEADVFFKQIKSEVRECDRPVTYGHTFQSLQQSYDQLKTAYQEYQTQIYTIKQLTNQRIQAFDQQSLLDSYNRWDGGERHEMSHAILNRRHLIDPVTEAILGVRLKMKVSWQWPALVFRPFHAWHVESLVGCDPMYFIDTDKDLLAATDSYFTPEYQRRICRYEFKEHNDQPMLSQLPVSQFGLVYAPFFLNFRPMEMIQQYLLEVLGLLRPGGYFVFTFNNCDTVSGAQLFERFSGSYAPGRLVKAAAETPT